MSAPRALPAPIALPLANVGGALLLALRALRLAYRQGVSRREVLVQMNEIGNRSSWLVLSGLSFFGVVMVTIANEQARRFTGNVLVVGPAFFELLIRELAPMMVALLTAAGAAAAASAELASMTVSEQVEALEMSAGDPLLDLVAPRVIASILVLPALCVLGAVAASTSAVLTTFFVFDADGFAFVDPRFISWGDFACAGIKAVLCGLYIPAAASRRGLTARGGAPAVGLAVTRGVVDAALGCLIIDFVVALAFLLIGV